MSNTNCLRGMRCFHCGHTESFRILATSLFLFYDDGTEDYGDVEYDSSSLCICEGCKLEATVQDFMANEGDLDGETNDQTKVL